MRIAAKFIGKNRDFKAYMTGLARGKVVDIDICRQRKMTAQKAASVNLSKPIIS